MPRPQIDLYLGYEWDPLPDHEVWINRFRRWAEKGGQYITIGQQRETRGWACTCATWKHWGSTCPHLAALGLPTNGEPMEVFIKGPHASIAGLRRQVNNGLELRQKAIEERKQKVVEAVKKAMEIEAEMEDVQLAIEAVDRFGQAEPQIDQLILDEDDV